VKLRHKPKPTVDAEGMATHLYKPAYATGLWRLHHDGLIPEGVTLPTFATTREPKTIQTKIGPVRYEQIPPHAFFGYQEPDGARVATPEKALLDFFWLQDVDWNAKEFARWRLQDDWKILHKARLLRYAEKWGEPRLIRAALAFWEYLRPAE
jgi:hypothetical protein